MPTAFDYVQNTADGIDRYSDYPQASNVKGDVLELLSTALLCGACDNQDDAAFATVVAEKE